MRSRGTGKSSSAAVRAGFGLTTALFFALTAVLLLRAPGGAAPAAAQPALIVVGFLMASVIREIDFSSIGEGLPALLTLTLMPFTFSITNGIGAGFVTYTFLRLVSGRGRTVHWLMYVITAAFVVYFALDYIERRFEL